jgi:hypothetical protein
LFCPIDHPVQNSAERFEFPMQAAQTSCIVRFVAEQDSALIEPGIIRRDVASSAQRHTGYGAAMPHNTSIEYFPAPVMYNSKKPPIMLRFL